MEIIDTQNHSKLINARNGKNVEFLHIKWGGIYSYYCWKNVRSVQLKFPQVINQGRLSCISSTPIQQRHGLITTFARANFHTK
jgi:ribosomal protein L15E